ncbi:MAG: acetate kinase [Oscillospiraceae bacterium]|jgi:acetate kinase|nr:acetate kinase [Oscillospiraceae bacterium]
MNILVINAGSSSLKYQLIDMTTESILAKGLCERIGINGSNIEQKAGGKLYKKTLPLKNHVEAFGALVDALTDAEYGAVPDLSSIGAAGHRVVHGAEAFTGSVLIDDTVMQALRDNIPLAPLHNPANIMGIEACRAVMPDVPMVAVFDTAFHQTMPRRAYLYGLPYEYYEQYKIRRYGFHGTSHRYVTARAAQLLGRPIEQLKLISCHMGNGSSFAAVEGGRSIDTTMGLTPLEGLIMGTRSGDIDPTVIEMLMTSTGMSLADVMSVLNKRSGLLGLSAGLSSDWRDVKIGAQTGNDAALRAAEVFAYRAKKYIGGYIAAMNGCDAILFTAGIGENDSFARALILKGMEYLGITLDPERNQTREEALISADESRVKVFVVPTNEELAIARDTLALTGTIYTRYHSPAIERSLV